MGFFGFEKSKPIHDTLYPPEYPPKYLAQAVS